MGIIGEVPQLQLHSHAIEISDPLIFYRTSVDLFGRENVFLLESLSGPQIDSRNTMIGLTGALEILISPAEIRLLGIPELQEKVRIQFAQHDMFEVNPTGVISYHTKDAVWLVPQLVQQALFPSDIDVSGLGFASMFGYDTVFYIEDMKRVIAPDAEQTSDIVFSVITALIDINKFTGEATLEYLVGDSFPCWDIAQWLEVQNMQLPTPTVVAIPAAHMIEDDTTFEEYLAGTAQCLEHIRQGDIYQIQYGHRIIVHTEADPIDVYQRLRERNPSPYMSILPLAGKILIGASPELFIKVEDGTITMRPIAGTAPRSGNLQKDEKAKVRLLADEKECAEHIMLVDLCRNDFGRVCEFGTIKVTEFLEIEEYSHVFHIVSHVEAQISDKVDVFDVIKATFPAGTMTGAPKIRAMEIIEEYEKHRRGFYAGAFGIIRLEGHSVLGLSIRTTLYEQTTHGPQYTLRASAGIVADSIPTYEWRETLMKLAAPFWAVVGKEISEVYSLPEQTSTSIQER